MIKKISCLVICCLLLIGCNNQDKNEDQKTVSKQSEEINTWCVYWDIDSTTQQEINKVSAKIDTLCYFGAYFQNEELFIPDALLQYHQKNKDKDFKEYLTVVNDVVTKDKTFLKDENIIKKILVDDDMNTHIEELVQLVKINDFDGLELDYEDFNTNISLWNQYSIFIDNLYTALQKENKGLRVLLEAKSPIDKVQLPKGPTYVMMCYNLYGGFSEPGPKANKEFLLKLKKKTENIENIEYALASGGFKWGDTKVTNVTVEEALQLADQHQVKPIQDTSGAWYFTYQENNKEYTIWFGDMETIEGWQKILKAETISLWKMGGNNFTD